MMAKETAGAGPVDQRVRLSTAFAGAKFRPVTWHALTETGADLKGYGVEVKAAGTRRYRIACVHGDTIPFRTKDEADAWCKAANDKAARMPSNAAMNGGTPSVR